MPSQLHHHFIMRPAHQPRPAVCKTCSYNCIASLHDTAGSTMAPADIGMCQCRLEEEKGLRIRFTTGLVPDEYRDEIAEEESKYGEFLRIPIKVRPLPYLTVQCEGLCSGERQAHACMVLSCQKCPFSAVQDSAVTFITHASPLGKRSFRLCLPCSTSAMCSANCTLLRGLIAHSSPSNTGWIPCSALQDDAVVIDSAYIAVRLLMRC